MTFHRTTLALLAAALVGCSSEAPTWPVKGQVVFVNRNPVKSGVIEFSPATGGPSARGKIGTDGRFELHTGQRLGAVAGPHRVAVVQLAVSDGAAKHVHTGHSVFVVHRKFNRFETSGLTQTVEAKNDNDFVIVVEPAVNKGGF